MINNILFVYLLIYFVVCRSLYGVAYGVLKWCCVLLRGWGMEVSLFGMMGVVGVFRIIFEVSFCFLEDLVFGGGVFIFFIK